MENYLENNRVNVGGIVEDEAQLSHEVFDEKFYRFTIKIHRLSDQDDILPVIVSEKIVNIDDLKKGTIITVNGQFRSYNMQVENKNKLLLTIFAKEVNFTDDEKVLSLNEASFSGYICKAPTYRETPLGRKIADILVAVNRTYKKSDYIPCILWGRNAKYCENVEVGTRANVEGRLQSRTYEKKLDNGDTINKIAYELSVSKFSIVDFDKDN